MTAAAAPSFNPSKHRCQKIFLTIIEIFATKKSVAKFCQKSRWTLISFCNFCNNFLKDFGSKIMGAHTAKRRHYTKRLISSRYNPTVVQSETSFLNISKQFFSKRTNGLWTVWSTNVASCHLGQFLLILTNTMTSIVKSSQTKQLCHLLVNICNGLSHWKLEIYYSLVEEYDQLVWPNS